MTPPKKNCPECGEEFYAFHLPGHRLREHGVEHVKGTKAAPKHAAADVPQETSEAPDEAAPGAVDLPEETAPRKPKLLDRLRSRRGRPGGSPRGPASAERPPKRKPRAIGRRVSLDSDISDVWGFAGRRLENSPHYPTGRMLQYQAPAAGVILDRALAGTLPDRLIFQPIARNRDKYEDVGFLLAGPLLTFSLTTTMQQMQVAMHAGDKDAYEDLSRKFDMQREMFGWVLSMMLPRLAAGKVVAEKKKAERDKVIADAFPELGGENPADLLADMLFAPPTFEEASFNGNGNPQPAHAPAPSGGEGAVPL